jgi:hypothetical protein
VILTALADGLYSLTSGIETVTVILTALADSFYSLTSGFFPLNATGVRLVSNSNSKGGFLFMKMEASLSKKRLERYLPS